MKIGVLGGGQLGRMLALASAPLGIECRFLDPAANACAGQVGELHVGAYTDEAVLAKFCDGVDVVTYEFENIPVLAVEWVQKRVPVFPGTQALSTAQDRLFEKNLCTTLGIPTTRYANVETTADLAGAIEKIGYPAMLKTRRMGYDGKGQLTLKSAVDLAAATTMSSVPLLCEERIAFQCEFSIVACRGQDGTIVTYPLSQNIHREGILWISRSPAPDVTPDLQAQADSIIRKILEHLQYVGVLAVELFCRDGQLLVNELAPRVHNSGHWTQNGCAVSQFENHMRAVAGLPVVEPSPMGYSAMVNILDRIPDLTEAFKSAGIFVHLYGKKKQTRKLGHINIVAKSAVEREELIKKTEAWLNA